MNTLHIYSPITDGTVAEVKNFLAANTGKPVAVRINSPGGSVFAGLTAYQLLKSHGAKVTTHVDGIAASIASVIALAGAERFIATGAMFMVHSASLATRGNAKQLVKDADTLAKVDGSLTDIYTAATKQTRAKITEMMGAETWLNAAEAVAMGFAHKIVAGQKIAACAAWKASDFPGMPQAALAAAGLKPSTRDTSAELDRLRAENLSLKARLAPAPKAAAPAPETERERLRKEYSKITDPAERRTFRIRHWSTLSGPMKAPQPRK
jgi:ATP-dependent protease ClpP protease subunit